MARSILYFLAVLSLLISFATAANPTSFCKCICFKNSTIIPLDAHTRGSSSADTSARGLRRRATVITEAGHGIVLGRDDENSDEDDVEDGDAPKEPPSDEFGETPKPFRPGNCNDCTKQFCLGYNLPMCKSATEEDVQTTCFQRDSSKDQAIVFIFIFTTAALLGWALIRPWVGKWVERARERAMYTPVANEQE